MTSKVIESTGHKVKDSTTSVGKKNSLIGKNSLIVLHFVDNIGFDLHELFYAFEILSEKNVRLCWQKTTNSSINPPTLTTMSPPISSTNLNSPQNGLDDLTPTPEKSPALPLVFASITLHDASASQERSYVVLITITSKQKPIAILFQIQVSDRYRFSCYLIQWEINLTFLPRHSIHIVTLLGLPVTL